MAKFMKAALIGETGGVALVHLIFTVPFAIGLIASAIA